MSKPVRRVLVYRLGSMGDTIVSLPALHLIERAFPGADRRLLTNMPINEKAAAAAAILAHSELVQGYFHYPVATRSPWVLLGLWWQLVRWRPEVLVYLGSARGVESARRDAKFFTFCGIKRQIGVPLTEEMQQNQWRADPGCEEFECERLVRNLAELGAIDVFAQSSWEMRFTDAERARADEALRPTAGRTVIAVSLGTKVLQNNWGQEKWRELLHRVGMRFPQYVLVFTGVRNESEPSDYAAEGWREGAGEQAMVLNLCGQLTPRESAAVFARARLFIGHDSGPMHLADAAGTQAVAIFSARQPPRRWFPHGREHHVVYHKVNCHGCGMRECTVEQMKCVTSVSVDEVYGEVCAALEDRWNEERAPWLSTYEVQSEGVLNVLEEVEHAS